MQSFFDSMTPWDHNDGSLHVYVLPDDDVADRIEDLQSRIDGDLSMAELTRLSDELTVELAGVAAFDLEVGGPQVHDVAVECVAEATPRWDALVDGVRRAALATFGGTMPDRPYAPHVSLAYATGEVSDEELRARLDGAPGLGPVRVGKVHLVSVTVRPEVGTFDFIELANWSL